MKKNTLLKIFIMILIQFFCISTEAAVIIPEDVANELETIGYTTDESGFFEAASDGNTDAIGLYLQSNMSVNQKDEYGRTAVYAAALNGRVKAVKYLILNGADINVRDEDLKTPLFAAIEGKSFEISKILIDAGSSIRITDTEGKTPLHYAILNNQLHTAQYILSGYCEVNAVDDLGNTPLFYAAGGNVNLIQALINAGADQNYLNSDGRTALHEAVIRRNIAVINYLIENGANLNIKDNFDKTPIYYANPNSFIYKKLLESGAAKPVDEK